MLLILDWTNNGSFSMTRVFFELQFENLDQKKNVFDNWNVASAQQLNRRNCEQKKAYSSCHRLFRKGWIQIILWIVKIMIDTSTSTKTNKMSIINFLRFQFYFSRRRSPIRFRLNVVIKIPRPPHFFFHFKIRKFKFFDWHPSSPGKGTTSRHWTWKDSLVRSSPFLAKSRF